MSTSSPGRSTATLQRTIAVGVPMLVLVAGLLSAFHPMLLSGFRRLQADPGDTRFLHYVLEHTYRWVRGDPLHQSLWDPPFFHPHRNALAFSDTLLSVAPFYWAFRAVGIPLKAAFGLWMVAMSVLNFGAGLAFIRCGFGRTWPAASLGAFLIAFGNSRMLQLGHQQLLPHFYTLLALLALLHVFHDHAPGAPRRRRLAWCMLFGCSVAQLYAGYYNGYFLFLLLLFLGLLSVVTPAGRRRLVGALRADPFWPAVCALASVLAVIPLAWHYWLALSEVGGRTPVEIACGLARPASYVWMGSSHWLYGWVGAASGVAQLTWAAEHAVGLGLLTTVIMVAFLWRQRHRLAVRLSLALVVISLVLFTRTEHFEGLGPVLCHVLPGIQGIRVMVRMAILLLIPAGLAVASLADGGRSRRRHALSLVLALFCCVEQLGHRASFEAGERDGRVNSIRRALPDGASAFYLARHDPANPASLVHIDAMWASLLEGVPTVNGYSGAFPTGFLPLLFEGVQGSDQTLQQKQALREWTGRYRLSDVRVEWIDLRQHQDAVTAQAGSTSLMPL